MYYFDISTLKKFGDTFYFFATVYQSNQFFLALLFVFVFFSFLNVLCHLIRIFNICGSCAVLIMT